MINASGSFGPRAILLVLLTSWSLSAQTPLPSAATVIKRYFDAIGGDAVLSKIQSARVKGTLTSSSRLGSTQQGSASGETLYMRPRRYRTIGAGCNDLVCWTGQSNATFEMTGPLRDMMRRQGDFFGIFRLPDETSRARVIDRIPFGDSDVFVVKLPTADTFDALEMYDTKTGLMVGLELRSKTGKQTSTYSGHKTFSGLLLPTKVVSTTAGGEVTSLLTEVEFNTLSESDFTAPTNLKRFPGMAAIPPISPPPPTSLPQPKRAATFVPVQAVDTPLSISVAIASIAAGLLSLLALVLNSRRFRVGLEILPADIFTLTVTSDRTTLEGEIAILSVGALPAYLDRAISIHLDGEALTLIETSVVDSEERIKFPLCVNRRADIRIVASVPRRRGPSSADRAEIAVREYFSRRISRKQVKVSAARQLATYPNGLPDTRVAIRLYGPDGNLLYLNGSSLSHSEFRASELRSNA